jgi:hypothetical protein
MKNLTIDYLEDTLKRATAVAQATFPVRDDASEVANAVVVGALVQAIISAESTGARNSALVNAVGSVSAAINSVEEML